MYNELNSHRLLFIRALKYGVNYFALPRTPGFWLILLFKVQFYDGACFVNLMMTSYMSNDQMAFVDFRLLHGRYHIWQIKMKRYFTTFLGPPFLVEDYLR